jgi:NAD(P)-dependent dehydrogenase (short-subunit alcohol dehydrogenase family)
MPAPVIIVTGVSRGIGRASASELQSRGTAVVGAARNVADVPATASLLPVAADVTQETGRKPWRCAFFSDSPPRTRRGTA